MVSGISIFEMYIFQTYQMLGIYFTSLFWHHSFSKQSKLREIVAETVP